MATITQLAPIVDTVISPLSGSYVNNLQATGNTGTLTWTTTQVISGLVVSASGKITTTQQLPIGAYTVGGNVSDTNGNSGTWTFTLTSVSSISPGTAVTPVQSALPTGVEIMVPFQIDPATGGVAVITDYGAIMAQHIETIVLTALNERVMNPTYGFGLDQAVFKPINQALPNTIESDIMKAVTKWEPRVRLEGVTVVQATAAPNVLNVTIGFYVIPFNDLNTLAISTGGTLTQVNPT